MAENKPKLTLKKNVKTRITLRTEPDQAKKYSHEKYGDSFMYFVESEGAEYAMFATPLLHDLLVSNKIFKDMIIDLTKAEADGNKIQWEIEIVDLEGQPSATAMPPDDEMPPVAEQQSINYGNGGTGQPLPAWKLREISIWMQVALKEAVIIQTARIQAGHQDDIDADKLTKDMDTIYRKMVAANDHFVKTS